MMNKSFVGEILWDDVYILFLIIFSSTNFVTHWWYLPATIIALVFAN